jgi:beta-lactam-binding protein with PASTA domain
VPCQPNPDGTAGRCGPEMQGKVFETNPPPNSQVRKSDRITLLVGAAPDKISVPDVKGRTLDEAVKALTDAKLTVAPNPQQVEVDDQNLVGKVAEQSPPAGQSVNVGTVITLTIGREPSTVNVPNLVGQNFDTAKTNLEGLGFKVERKDVSSAEPEGEVVDQSPKSGKARPGSTITLSVSKGDQERIRLPDLIGQTPQEANQTLRERGWTGQLNQVDDPSCNVTEVGRITEQEKPEGTEIAANEDVNVRVCRRPTA